MKTEKQMDSQTTFPLPCCARCRWYQPVLDKCTASQEDLSETISWDCCPYWEDDKCNGKKKFLHERQEELQALWWNGKNDREIAEIVGCTPQAIRKWRKKNDLPPNGETRRQRKGGTVYRG